MHEASQWTHNSFITLTYDDDHIPKGGYLVKKDLQDFIKRTRAAVERSKHKNDTSFTQSSETTSFRFFSCGEYGTHTMRPHYHILLFNLNFGDKYKVAKDYYESETLQKLWSKNGVPIGTHKIGEVTHKSAAYIARYSSKSSNAPYITEDGEIAPSPFLQMSNRPAIGRRWLERYHDELKNGFMIIDGNRVAIPRYYKEQLGPEWKKKFLQAQLKRGLKPKSERELNNMSVISRTRSAIYEQRSL